MLSPGILLALLIGGFLQYAQSYDKLDDSVLENVEELGKGDIMYYPPVEILEEDASETSRAKRAASIRSAKNFPTNEPIPFIISSRYNESQQELIRTTLVMFEENTCISFEENGEGLTLEFDDIYGGPCNSEMGDWRDERMEENGTNQIINLGDGCFTIDIIQHEVMHALGFDHTQSRPDRHHFVDIFFDRINESWVDQYNLTDESDFESYSIPYEYDSVMGYNPIVTSKDGETPVLVPKDDDYITAIGGGHGATFNDWKVINIRYNCKSKCPVKIFCRNKGYQNSRDCTRCVCPAFYTGLYCDYEVDVINLSQRAEEKVSLKYTSPERRELQEVRDFTKFDKVLHVIKAPEGRLIRITLDEIEIGDAEISCIFECKEFAVEIVIEEDLSLAGKRFCCANRTGYSFLSKTNVVGYQAYSRPGWYFSSQVTFTLEPPEETSTEEPTDETSETEPPQNDQSTTDSVSTDQQTAAPTTELQENDTSTTFGPTTDKPLSSSEVPHSSAPPTQTPTTEQPGITDRSTAVTIPEAPATDETNSSTVSSECTSLWDCLSVTSPH